MTHSTAERERDTALEAAIRDVLRHCAGSEDRYRLELACWIRNTYTPCRKCGHAEKP